MAIQTKYVTLDEFKQYSGIDLQQRLGDGALPFLTRIETRTAAFLNARLFQNIDEYYPTFSDFQKSCYKTALIEQAMYVLRNGDISLDSGYDQEGMKMLSNAEMNTKIMCENAKEQLMICGIWTHKMKNYGRDNIFWKGGLIPW